LHLKISWQMKAFALQNTVAFRLVVKLGVLPHRTSTASQFGIKCRTAYCKNNFASNK